MTVFEPYNGRTTAYDDNGRAPRLLSGPEANLAANQVREREERHTAWPYRWEFAPPDATRRNPQGFVTVPASLATSVVLAFQVPTLSDFIWTEVILGPSPSFDPEWGDLTYILDVDTPVSNAPLTSSPFADFQAFSIPLGSFTPWETFKLPKAETIKSGQTLRAKVTNVNSGSGAPASVGAIFIGWLVPAVR